VDPLGDRVGPCVVRRVIDGDTLDVSCDGLRDRVRLLRIDTPEFRQKGYREASRALERYVGGAAVYLDYERPGEPERDAYGRLLAYVWSDELNVNVEIVRDGWSRFFTRHGEGRLAGEFVRAEREARTGRRGLWARR
jgi:micrococcal nuclease